jgi:hypothetical protein
MKTGPVGTLTQKDKIMFPERRKCPRCGRLICYHDYGPPGADGEPTPLCRPGDVQRARDLNRAAKGRTTRKLRRSRDINY